MTIDPETIHVYDERADEYARVTASDRPDSLLQAFIDVVPVGGHVLDLGCGPGNFSAHLVKAGFHVTATDASAEMVARAGRIDGVTAHQATFDDLNEIAAFDGVWANFSLLHAPRAAMPRHLSAIHCALKPRGPFHLALKTGIGDKRDRLGRYYTYYTPEELSSLLTMAGFTIMKMTPGRDKGLDGAESDWISVATHA